jgi:hypothetical protein
MADRATPLPVRVRVEDTELRCDVQRIIGYQAVCRCGWRGGYTGTYGHARADAHTHNREQHGGATKPCR